MRFGIVLLLLLLVVFPGSASGAPTLLSQSVLLLVMIIANLPLAAVVNLDFLHACVHVVDQFLFALLVRGRRLEDLARQLRRFRLGLRFRVPTFLAVCFFLLRGLLLISPIQICSTIYRH